MAIKFKSIERGQPGVIGGGDKKFYASAVSAGEVSLEQLTTFIEKISTVSGADIRAVLYALVDVSIDSLAKGEIVRLGDLGSLRVSLKSTGFDSHAEVNSAGIKGTNIIFTPGSRIKTMQQTLKFQKV